MRSFVAGALTLSCVLAAAAARAQGIEIDHQGVGCVVAGRYPTLETRFRPASAVGRAEVLFRARGTIDWYAVAMKAQGDVFVGVLPSPRPDIGGFEYFIDVTAVDMRASRSPEFSPDVVPRAQDCGTRLVAAALGKVPALLVRAPAGAPTVPAGFLAAGIAGAVAPAGAAGAATAGSGGLSAGWLIAGGAALAGGAAAVAASGGDDSAPAATPPAATTPSRYYEIRLACAELNGVQVGSTIGFQDGIGRWPTIEAARAALSGHSATITLDGVPLAVTYEGLTWHTGGETEPGYGDRALATWVVTAGTHTVVARWTLQPSVVDSCTFTVASR